MSSEDYEIFGALRDARRRAREKHGVPCPRCLELLPKANPSILLPSQKCKIHGYRDPRKRIPDEEYFAGTGIKVSSGVRTGKPEG